MTQVLLYIGIPLIAIALELMLAIAVGRALRYGIGAAGTIEPTTE